MIKNTLPNKSRNPESLKKIIIAVGKPFNQCVHSWWGFAEGTLQLVLFKLLCFKKLVAKHCVGKILQGIWERVLFEHDHNYNSYKFSFKFTFIPLFSFIETKNKRHIFSKLVVWQREILLLFIYSESRSTSKVCQIQ